VAGHDRSVADETVQIRGDGSRIHHNKVMIIDGETMIGGSFNYTKGAQNQNAENVEITRSQALAAKYTENWQTHARHSEPYVGRGVAR
jgi:phosphatidylserine/phosphatidylglycerophosphate/cardiolipin synthase-like enzyme